VLLKIHGGIGLLVSNSIAYDVSGRGSGEAATVVDDVRVQCTVIKLMWPTQCEVRTSMAGCDAGI
jgi:hypothetical protein